MRQSVRAVEKQQDCSVDTTVVIDECGSLSDAPTQWAFDMGAGRYLKDQVD